MGPGSTNKSRGSFTIRYERRADIHQAFLDVGCALICLDFLLRRP